MTVIPLEQVAEDARPLVAAFRAAGEPSVQSGSVEEARAAYRLACQVNGLDRAQVALVQDHRVAVVDGEISIREYRPHAAEGLQPALVFVHGGGWVIGDLDTHDGLCRHLARGTGRVVIAVDYRLAPKYPFPIPVQDCAAALAWIVANANVLALDVAQIATTGDSAGANLVAALANAPELRPAGFQFDRLALLYPVTQLDEVTASYQRITSGFALTAASMAWFLGHYLGKSQAAGHAWASPLRADHLADIPHYILSCGLDPLADDAIAYAKRAIDAGLRVEHHHLPRHPHGIFTLAGKIATGVQMLESAAHFLRPSPQIT